MEPERESSREVIADEKHDGRVRQGTVPWRTNKFHESLTCELSNGMVI